MGPMSVSSDRGFPTFNFSAFSITFSINSLAIFFEIKKRFEAIQL
jgi:hypothetical protein